MLTFEHRVQLTRDSRARGPSPAVLGRVHDGLLEDLQLELFFLLFLFALTGLLRAPGPKTRRPRRHLV